MKPSTSTNPAPIPPSVVQHAAVISDFCAKARAAASKLLGESEGEVQLMRLVTKNGELLVAPSAECTLVVSQRSHSAGFAPLVARTVFPKGQPTAVVVAEE